MIPPCGTCGGSMPAVPLNQVYVTCPYCGHVGVAPPPPPSAWLAQHHELVKGPTRTAAQVSRINSIVFFTWVLLIGGTMFVGCVTKIAGSL